MKLFNKLAYATVSETVNSAGNVIDKLITNDEERAVLKNELAKIISEHTASLVNSAKEVVLAEANGNWLQRSWRPLLMLQFGFIVVYEYFLSKVFGWPPANLPVNFWELLEIGMGGFVIGRSAEKISKTIAENWQHLPGKNKK